MLQALSVSTYMSIVVANYAITIMAVPYPAVDAVTGSDSQMQTPEVSLAQGPSAWNTAWQEHRFTPPIGNSRGLTIRSADTPPAVDFSKNVVLVVFGGLVPGVAGYALDSSFYQGGTIKVRVRPVPIANVNARSVVTNPYAFFVFPKTDKKFSIEAPESDGKGGTVWKLIAQVGG